MFIVANKTLDPMFAAAAAASQPACPAPTTIMSYLLNIPKRSTWNFTNFYTKKGIYFLSSSSFFFLFQTRLYIQLNEADRVLQHVLILLKTKPYIFLRYPQPSQHLYTNHPQPFSYSQKNQMLLYLLESYGLDDVVGAIPVHMFAGIFGTLVVPLTNPDTSFGTQLIGTASVCIFSFALSWATFTALKSTIGLRISKAAEKLGTDKAEVGVTAYSIRD